MYLSFSVYRINIFCSLGSHESKLRAVTCKFKRSLLCGINCAKLYYNFHIFLLDKTPIKDCSLHTSTQITFPTRLQYKQIANYILKHFKAIPLKNGEGGGGAGGGGGGGLGGGGVGGGGLGVGWCCGGVGVGGG